MKNTIRSIIILILFSACTKTEKISPSGEYSNKEYSFGPIYACQIDDGIDLIYTDTNEDALVIKANDNIHDYIDVDFVNNTLFVEIKSGYRIERGAHITVYLDAPDLSEIYLRDGSTARSVGEYRGDDLIFEGSGGSYFDMLVTGRNCFIELSGGSEFIGDFEANKLDARLSGGSEIDFIGICNQAEINLSSESIFLGYDFITDDLQAFLSGASRAKMYVNDQIDYEGNGESILFYDGDPYINTAFMSDGSALIRR